MTISETTDLIRRTITRIAIPPGQITLFKALYENLDGLSKKSSPTPFVTATRSLWRGSWVH
jgi:hypothetical protein